jgi:phosphatidylglycerophosphate synthase
MRGALRQLPLGLTVLRALLAPVVVWLAVSAPRPWAFALCLVAAFVSDVFDGVLARRLGLATPNLRRLDSVADSLFYLGCLYAAWHLLPAAITTRADALMVLWALELARYAFDAMKFGREASYHMWSSKLWGIALFVGFFGLLVFGWDGPAMTAAVWLGILADLEGLAISLVLPTWRADVPSLLHALQLRRSGQGAGAGEAP